MQVTKNISSPQCNLGQSTEHVENNTLICRVTPDKKANLNMINGHLLTPKCYQHIYLCTSSAKLNYHIHKMKYSHQNIDFYLWQNENEMENHNSRA